MLFSRKDLIRIIVPLMIEQVLAVTIGIADSMMVASVGEAAVSGVSLVDSINILLINIFSALATGGAVICSQFLGRRDYDLACSAAKQLIYTVFLLSVLLMSAALIFRTPLLRLIFGTLEADVFKNAKTYFMYSALSYPFLGLYNSGAALFRAMGNSKISMRASLIMNIINISGNAILIFIFKWGVAGAAIATLISRMVGAAIMLVLLHNKENAIFIEKLFRCRPNFNIIKNILKIGVPSGLENGMFQFGKLLTQSLISTFGTAAISANAAASALSNLQYIPGTAIGLSMITIVGRCIGAEDIKQAKYYAVRLLGVAYVSIITVTVIMTIFINPIVGLYNLSPTSTATACRLMIYHAFCVCTVWPLSFPLPNVFRAASDVRYPMVVSVISMWTFRVCLSYILGGYFRLGVMGVWIAMTSDWLFRAVLFSIRYICGKWTAKYKPVTVKS